MSLSQLNQGTDIIKLFEAEAMRAEHIMGLDGKMEFKSNNGIVSRKGSGNYASTSLGYLNEKLNAYIPTLQSEDRPDWLKIRNAFTKAQQEAKNGNPVDCVKDNLKRIKAGADKDSRELVHLGNSMWFGEDPHSIGITFYGNYMVVCDRGMYGGEKDCTKIYKIDPKEITSDQLERLQSTPNDPKVILGTISEIANNKEPIATFPSKLQKFGTCNYSNRLTSVEPMLCLVKLDRQGKLNDEAIKEYSQNKDRKAYKSFTRYNRDTEANRIITKMNAANKNPELQAMYANLVIEIVKNRQKYIDKMSDPDKAEAETKRNDKFLSAVAKIYTKLEESITPANRQFFAQNISKVLTKPDSLEEPQADPIDSLLEQKDTTFVPGHESTSHPNSSLESALQQLSITIPQIKNYLEKAENKALLNITKVEEQQLGFKPKGRLKIEIQASTDASPINVYIDDNGKGGADYSLDENASPEQKKRSIESICKIAVQNSTKETEFNLEDTPDDIKAEMKTALENAIKEKYKNSEEAPKIISSEPSKSLKVG
ncbi:MAG: hypothetical protein HYX61_13495 [Gammaproteobacteria bacterium]|jgi:hypothetical protein|nr:hypothetical protein [Gammaproteobacteria bacterium]